MGFRIDSVAVRISVYVEFEGHHDIEFTYTPSADDPLVNALLAKNTELSNAAVAADTNPINPFFG
jgi:hypothetical protein